MAPGTLARLERAVEGFSAQLQCAICLCVYDKPVSLPCNHCFCEECIHRALELKPLCPICKTPAKKRRLRFDSTVQALLRATEMLTAAPGATSVAASPLTASVEEALVVKTEKAAEPVKQAAEPVKEAGKQVKTEPMQVNAAVAAATPERRSSPRRRTPRNSQKSPTTPTLMDVWVRGGNTQQLRNGFKIKTEKMAAPVRRSSPRRALANELSSQASPLSPALFEIAPPRPKKTQAEAVITGSSLRGGHVDTVDLPAEDDEKQTELPRDGLDTSELDAADTAMETQLEADEQQHQTSSPRRRRQTSDSVEVDVVVAETQPEVLEEEVFSPRRRQSPTDSIAQVELAEETQKERIESKQEAPALRERRRSATDALAGETTARSTEIQTRRRKSVTDIKPPTKSRESQDQQTVALRSRLRSASNGVATDAATDQTQLEAVEPVHQTPPPRKRRRSATNGVVGTVESVRNGTPRQSLVNGKAASANGSALTSSLAMDSQTGPPFEVEVFQIGHVVEVIERQWVGINKRGGTARITKVHGDGFYAVKFLIGGGSDHRVPGAFIRRPSEELVSDSTPSTSVRKRQRRRLSDSMVSPSLLAVRTRSSPHSAESTRVATKKSKPEKKDTGMVFLCSGFKEDRMQQIEQWADLLGAQVVQHWTNQVTHLIAKCVSEDEVEEDDLSPQDSDSASLPQGRSAGKRKLLGSQKPGRWVKIRSLKYLKALVGGRWIVSDEWLRACADHGGRVSEVNYEADGHWKGRRIHDAVRRSRLTREKLLQLSLVDKSDVGTMLFSDFCFHVIGEFLPPMPPITELNALICMGGGKLLPFMDDIPDEMHKRENHGRKLIIVSDKLNAIALRQQTRQLRAQPQVKAVAPAIIVNYLWVINSISEAKLRELP